MLPEQHRDMHLTAAETQVLVRALDAEPDQEAATALMLLILTRTRKSEILQAQWENLDLDLGLARSLRTIPRSKSGRPRHIPLSEQAVRVLVRQHQRCRFKSRGPVYPDRLEGRSLEDRRGPWKRAKKPAEPAPATRIHDLRYSFASALANHGAR